MAAQKQNTCQGTYAYTAYAYATVIVPVVTPIRHLLGAPHGIASVGCWTGTGFGTEEETHWALWFASMAGFLIMESDLLLLVWEGLLRRTVSVRVCSVADFYKLELEWSRAVFTHQAVHDELITGIKQLMRKIIC